MLLTINCSVQCYYGGFVCDRCHKKITSKPLPEEMGGLGLPTEPAIFLRHNRGKYSLDLCTACYDIIKAGADCTDRENNTKLLHTLGEQLVVKQQV